MSEEEQKGKRNQLPRLNLDSKFWKAFLFVVAAFLIFAGPTYVVYVLMNVLDISYVFSMISGFALFIVGLVLLWYLIKNKVVS
ncbi:MAG: hypothetical protein K6T73_06020 [Candidatus Bathyarchaeota archaeon]|nr:hypothetical protein [Candidatus Bathyarchaeota archaeon]